MVNYISRVRSEGLINYQDMVFLQLEIFRALPTEKKNFLDH